MLSTSRQLTVLRSRRSTNQPLARMLRKDRSASASARQNWVRRASRVSSSALATIALFLDLGLVANRLDVVPVRSDDEGCVVVCMVVRTQAWRAIVFTASLHRRAVKSLDLLAGFRRKGQVQMGRLLRGLE